MADNHLFRSDADFAAIGELLREHEALHAKIRVADEARDKDNLDILATRVDDNVRELYQALGGGGLRGLYGLLHIVAEAFATVAVGGIVLEGEDVAGINAFIAEGQRISEIAVAVLLTGGGGDGSGLSRSGFKPPPVDADLGKV